MVYIGRFPFRQHRRQTRQRLFTLPQSPDDDPHSINGNTGKSGDTGFAGEMESALRLCILISDQNTL